MAVKKTMPGTPKQPVRDSDYAGNRMGQPNEQAKEAFNPPATTPVPQAAPAQSTFKAPSGYTRVSPGLYRDTSGKLVPQAQISGKMAEPLQPPPAATTPQQPRKPITAPAPYTQTPTPEQTQQALTGGYRLPTQQELAAMFQQRYEQELGDITVGAAERQAREQREREQYLADRGISPDSQAYRGEQQALAESRALEAAQARSQARQFAEGATTAEFNRTLQAVGAAQEERKIGTAERQWEKTYKLEQKRILSDIQNNKLLTKLEKQKIKSAERQGDLERANRLAIAAMQRAGQGEEAQQYADRVALLRDERFQYMTRQPDAANGIAGLGLTPEEATKILEKEERGGSRESQIRMRS
jgi:hypothetical protein